MIHDYFAPFLSIFKRSVINSLIETMLWKSAFLVFLILLLEVYDAAADETCYCQEEDGRSFMKHCRSCCGEARNQHCCEDEGLSGGHIAGIAVGSVVFLAIAIAVGVCLYKKKCKSATKTSPSGGTVINCATGPFPYPEKKQPFPGKDGGYSTEKTGPLPLAEVPIGAPPAYQMIPDSSIPVKPADSDRIVSPPPPYSTSFP